MKRLSFYQTTTGRINGLIFEKSGDGWVRKSTIDSGGFTLESVEITDITNDGHRDIVVGYSNDTTNSETSSKRLVIYSYDKGKVVQVDDMPYSYYSIVDMDGDGINDLVISKI